MHPAQGLCSFIEASPSPRHAARSLVASLAGAGYRPLDLTAPRWELAAGGWYVARGATALLRDGSSAPQEGAMPYSELQALFAPT